MTENEDMGYAASTAMLRQAESDIWYHIARPLLKRRRVMRHPPPGGSSVAVRLEIVCSCCAREGQTADTALLCQHSGLADRF
jgi:hypothetical protein